jgi:hypothetical protein
MSANFLDTSGNCAGIDGHTYFAIGPAGVPLPMPLVPHIIAWKHSWKSRDWRIAKTVTTGGNPVLQGNWAMIFVVHVPIPVAAPHAIEAVQLAGIIMAGSAAPQLTAHKVTAQENPLLTEISGTFGLNLDCADFLALSKDFNANTVMTQPTLGDYLAAIISTALSFLYAWASNKVIGGTHPVPDKIAPNIAKQALEKILLNIAKQAVGGLGVAILQNLLDMITADPTANAISKISQLVQRLVDGEPVNAA